PRATLGEHEAVQGGAGPARLRHRPLGDADHAGDDGRPGHGRPVQPAAVRGVRLRPAGRLPDRRDRQGANPDDRHGRPCGRAAGPSAGGVRDRRSRARPDRGVSEADPRTVASDPAPQATDLPFDGHLHTNLSPDSDVPIDDFAAQAVARRIPEIAITDHVDFVPGTPAYDFTTFEGRERVVREAAARWAPDGVTIRIGVEITYD